MGLIGAEGTLNSRWPGLRSAANVGVVGPVSQSGMSGWRRESVPDDQTAGAGLEGGVSSLYRASWLCTLHVGE